MKLHMGEKIISLRLKYNYTQEKLAQLCNVSSAAVSKWENNLSCPDIATLPTLARIFHTTIDDLFDFEQDIDDNRIAQLIDNILQTFETASFEEGMNLCKTMVHTYPHSELLKLKIAGSYLQVTILLLSQDQGEKKVKEFERYAETLCEALNSSNDWLMRQSACILMSSFATMNDHPQKALEMLENLPKLTNTTSIESSLYIQMGNYEKAEKLLQTQLYTDANNCIMMLFSLIRIAILQNRCHDAICMLQTMENLNTLMCCSSTMITQCFLYYAQLQDKKNTLRLLKEYLSSITHMNDHFSTTCDTLHNVPWFSNVELKENTYPQKAINDIVPDIFHTIEDLDFLRNDEDYKQLMETFQQMF